MTSTFTPNVNLEEPANGDYVNDWNVPVNSNFTIIDTAIGGNTTINVVGASATNTLTLTQYQNRILVFSGTMTINQTWQIPSGIGGFWYIVNITTGPFTLTLASAAGGTNVTCAQGTNTIILSTGTNILLAQNSPTPAAGAAGQVQLNIGGSLGVATGLTYDSTNNILASPNFLGNHEGTVDPTALVGAGGPLVGYRNIPLSANTSPDITDIGKYLTANGNVTISSGVFSTGDVFSILNTTGSGSITINQGTGVFLRLAGSTALGNRTLAVTGLATLLCIGSNVFVVSGAGVS